MIHEIRHGRFLCGEIRGLGSFDAAAVTCDSCRAHDALRARVDDGDNDLRDLLRDLADHVRDNSARLSDDDPINVAAMVIESRPSVEAAGYVSPAAGRTVDQIERLWRRKQFPEPWKRSKAGPS